jgi:hypothetical protein
MRPVFHTTIVLLALVLSACEMKTTRAKTPSPPQPDSAKTESAAPESAPAEPLSSPQTQVRLPSPQPIDPDALATPPVYVPADASQTNKARHSGKKQGPQPASAASPGKPETVEAADAPPATETSRPPIGPVLSDEERRRMTEDISSRLQEVEKMLGRIHPTDAEKASVEKIRSFQKLSHDALERGEIQQANALADRAVLLAQEVLHGR